MWGTGPFSFSRWSRYSATSVAARGRRASAGIVALGVGRIIAECCRHPRMEVALEPARPASSFFASFFDLARQRIEQPEVRVHRLEVARVGVAEIAIEPAQHGGRRRDGGRTALQPARQVDAREKPGAERLGVALDAGELAGEEEAIVVPGRERGAQARGAVQVGVPVNAAVAEKLRRARARESSGTPAAAPGSGAGSGSRPGSTSVPPCPPAAAGRPRGARGRCAGRAGPPASSGRSGASPAPAGPSPRPAGSPRSRAPGRTRAPDTGPPPSSASRKALVARAVQRRVQVIVAVALAVAGERGRAGRGRATRPRPPARSHRRTPAPRSRAARRSPGPGGRT